MDLTYRPATAQDVEACLEMLPPGFAGAAAIRARMADAWRSWLREGVIQMTVLKDGDRPPGLRRIAFGNSVFIGESFAEEAKTSLPPPLGAQVAHRWREGRSPVLGLDALRAANSGPGLTLLILHIGWMPKLPAEEVRWAKGKLLEAMLFFFSGYQLNEVLQEVYSEEERVRARRPRTAVTCRPYFFQSAPILKKNRGAGSAAPGSAGLCRRRSGGEPERVGVHSAEALAGSVRAHQHGRAGLFSF